MSEVPEEWPYADEPHECAACGSSSDAYRVVESLGLVWGAAMEGGLDPSAVSDYGGTLRFRCCRDCWTEENVEVLEEARTLLDDDAARRRGNRFVLDDEKVAAAAKLDARRVAVGDLRRLEFRSDPEREHVRAQDEAVAAVLESWFEEEQRS